MKTQNQIKRTLSETGNIEYIRGQLENKSIHLRIELAEEVCEHFGFFDPRGRKQVSGCLKALRELEAAGHFILPESRSRPGPGSPKRLSEPVANPADAGDRVDEVNGLELILVKSEAHMRIWNEMMIGEHPQGAGPLVGRQMRYLISSDQGWLGGFGFASAALHLSARDKWIGWDTYQRMAHLDLVVSMSRFLIRPSVKCHNLASKVLGMSMSVLPEDFEGQYGYRPYLVESFVDSDHYTGTCYRAGNWIKVGMTAGRGRQDRFNRSALSVKEIYVYPLEKEFRKRMGLSADAGLGALTPDQGLERGQWAENEFGGAPLGDARLSKRLVSVVKDKAEVPGRAYSGVAKGDWPKVKAYYRMIDQPEESAVSMANILAPHRERTVRRMMGQRTVLCIQDGSDLNYTNLDQCEGLGELGSNQTGAKSRGLYLHSTFAVATNGLPLGVLHAQCIAPESKSNQEKRPLHTIPIEEKKTFFWIEHHRDLVSLSAKLPQTRLVHVCDREADFFEMFDEQRKSTCVELLVRAKHNRNIAEEPFRLFEAVGKMPIASRVQVHIPRQSARPKKSKQKVRSSRSERLADMAVRYMEVNLFPAYYHSDKKPITLWIVHALEENPPENTQPVEWFLLTTIKITSASQAEKCLRWYVLRWRIEDWHRVLKSGCRIEDLAHKTAERLRRAIAINMVIAWRIMLMALMGRETPELSAEVLFSDIEVKTLWAYAKKKNLKPPLLLGDAVKLVAKLGGYLGRKNDPPPGHQIIWQGYTVLQAMCLGFSLHEDG
ncbi:MAG: IS4 family transposase [Cellvibrio sp.]|uniref:IS4 family transposase n=1 Tax=Cellvibrio sp. TaxID=1965322 RepID=UPI00271B004D|nr:IS4 family transposase [Cellvibrio sp.]